MEHLKTVVLAVVLWSCNFILQANAGCLDELHFTGTHYDFGYCIGLQYKDEISALVNGNYSYYTNRLAPWYSLTSSSAAMGVWKARFTSAYQHYEDEMLGMAAGSEIDINKLYVLNFEPEIANFQNDFPETLAGTETTVMNFASGTNYLNNNYITHFIDWEPPFDANGFLVDAKIIDSKFPAIENQEFHALMYPGYLAGTTFAYNSHGLFYTANRLFQKQNPGLSLWPSCLYLRDIISAKNISEAYDITTSGGAAKIFALSYNVNFYETSGSSNFTVAEWSIDAPTGLSIQASGLIEKTQNIYYHFNAHKEISENTATSEFYTPLSTEYRESNTALFLLNGIPSTFAGVKTFVSNEEFSEFPQYRDVSKYTDHVTTINMIYDISTRQMYVYPGKPDSTYEAIVLTAPS